MSSKGNMTFGSAFSERNCKSFS